MSVMSTSKFRYTPQDLRGSTCCPRKVPYPCSVFVTSQFARGDGFPSVSDGADGADRITSPEGVQPAPSGYYYKDSWSPLGGAAVRQFRDPSAVAQCLTNKVVNMYGDSTVRQWFEYLIAVIPGKPLCVSTRLVVKTA